MNVNRVSKSNVSKFLLNNQVRVQKKDPKKYGSEGLFFYDKQENYLGDMTVFHTSMKNIRIIKVGKQIFNDKLKPLYQEYVNIEKNMKYFIDSKKEEKSIPISISTTKLIIDRTKNTQTTQVIERVLEKTPERIPNRYNLERYKLEETPIKYVISSVSEETQPFVSGKHTRIHNF